MSDENKGNNAADNNFDEVIPCPGNVCEADGCFKPATMKCPTCIKLGLPDFFFCDQDCFKKQWKDHNKMHKQFKAFEIPSYQYSGPLRPSFITPMRYVPQHIKKPDYYATGVPMSEMQSKASMKTPIYTKDQIAGIRRACKLGRQILDMAGRMVRPGITTEEIDRAVHVATIQAGAYPSPLNYNNFRKSCCTSVNEVVCHGIPDCRPLKDGDIVNIDITVYLDGYHGDLNETYCVGNVSQEKKDLIKATYDSLQEAIEQVKPGSMFRDFGAVISRHVHQKGFSVIKTYCGHGIGELFHCAPNVPHYKGNKAVGICRPGMVFTIEPMINMGHYKDKLWDFDDWTAVTTDGKPSAQFEHTMVVTEEGVEVLTARLPTSPPLWWEKSKNKKKKKKKKKKKNNGDADDADGNDSGED